MKTIFIKILMKIVFNMKIIKNKKLFMKTFYVTITNRKFVILRSENRVIVPPKSTRKKGHG